MQADKALPMQFATQDDILKDLDGGQSDVLISEALKMLLTPEQLDELKKKVQPKPRPVAKPTVVFTIDKGATSGQLYLQAARYRSKDVVDTLCFVGHPSKLEKFRRDPKTGNWLPWQAWGQSPSPEIIADYARRFDPESAGINAQAQDLAHAGANLGRLEERTPEQRRALGPFPMSYKRISRDDSGNPVKE